MMSQNGQQIITIYIVCNDSRCKDNQTVTFDQLIKYSVSNIFIQKSCRKWGRETSSRPLFVSEKSLRSKQVVNNLVLIYFVRPRPQQKQTLYYFKLMIRRYVQFWFLIKGSGTSFSTTSFYNFPRKIFLILYSINWSNFIDQIDQISNFITSTASTLNRHLDTQLDTSTASTLCKNSC